jgi:hypothetical protein
MIGLIAHFVYWAVFGHINKLPLDSYHRKQLFISISQIQAEVEVPNVDKRGSSRRIYATFAMPMLTLAIRLALEVIFKNSYPNFFEVDIHEKLAMKLINDVVTSIIDPNLYYSRFSFLESGREAINLKYNVILMFDLLEN